MGGKPFIWVATGYLAMLAGLGCNCQGERHGFILRGDWSIECNRVPWLVGARPGYCDSGSTCWESACGPEAQALLAQGAAGPSPTSQSPGGQNPTAPNPSCSPPSVGQCPPGAAQCPAGPAPPPPSPPGSGPDAGASACMRPPTGGRCPPLGGPAAPAPPPHVHSRFHPVPVRSVFSPSRTAYRPIPGGPFPRPPAPTAPRPLTNPAAAGVAPPRPIQLHVPDPPPEQPPPRPAGLPSDRQTRSLQRVSMRPASGSMVFTPGYPGGHPRFPFFQHVMASPARVAR